jgi:outer membrane protein assembly factor BamB
MVPGAALWLLAALEWPQFGGPAGNFHADVKGLASSWPAGGPRKLWTRDLGEGYSSIAIDGNVLYTMYRQGNLEVVLAADASTGKTLWEHRYDAAFLPTMKMENGSGPHATPLVTSTTVFTTGILGKLLALDKKTGKVLWSHDLFQEYGGRVPDRGYACSPVAYKDAILLKVGGPGAAVMAFRQKNGAVVWKQHDFAPSPSSLVVVQVSGQDQVVAFMGDQVVGLDPNHGGWLWNHPHRTDWGLNISTPILGPDNILFLSSAYGGGSRGLQLTLSGGKTAVKELWFTNRMRLHHGNAIRIGDHVYGSSGDFGPAPLTALDVKTGKIAWQDRTFSKATLLLADGKLILLDEDGNLALATVSPQGLQVLAKAEVLRRNAWTAPALAGTRLYLRDRRTLLALDLK